LILPGVLLVTLLACTCGGLSDLPVRLGQGNGGILGGACAAPLDEDTLSRLTISLNNQIPDSLSLEPGSSGEFSVGVVECCYIYEPADACVEWSIEPGDGASIDPLTGALSIDADAAAGSVYTVTADVEDGRSILTTDVTVFTPEANPLVGQWHEVGQFTCADGTEKPADPAIRELIFEADGSYSVTWFPFEVYRDYWGTYTYDLETGTLDMVADNGNHIPDDKDLSGTFEIDDQGRLLLHDLWFGSPPTETVLTGCGHIFSH